MARLVIDSNGKKTIVENYDRITGQPFNTRVLTHLPNGIPIVDHNVNNGVVFKNKQVLGGGYSVRSEFLEYKDVNATWFMPSLNVDNNGIENRIAIQEAIVTAKMFGMASVLIPAGDYNLDVSVPIIVPSDIAIRGLPRCTILRPDISTAPPTTDRPYPLTKDAVFSAGDLDTGIQFNNSGLGAGTGKNIYIYGIDIISEYERGAFPWENQLRGISLTYVDNAQVENCKVENMPHTGIYLYACRNFKIINNYANGNGFANARERSRNGIASAGSVGTSASFVCYNGVVTGNQCNYNYQEGIQYAAVKGIVISFNNCLGNGHLGIEGDNYADTTQTEEPSGIEVASQAIITNNYVDGTREDGSFGAGGISFNGGNEGQVIIANNMIRNIFGAPAISAAQNNKGILSIENNTIYNCDPSDPRHIISIKAEKAIIQNNKAYKSGGTFSSFLYIQGASEQITVKNNYCEKTAGAFIRAFTQAINPKWDISGNTWLGGGGGSVRITCQVDSNWDYLSIKNNNFYDCYTEMKLEVDSTRSIVVKKLIITGNDITYSANPSYAFSFVNVGEGAILKAIVKNNDFGDVSSSDSIFNDLTRIVKLYQGFNILQNVQQSAKGNILTLTGARTLREADFGDNGELTIYADVSSANLTITCSLATRMRGLTLTVIKTDSSANIVTVKGNGSQLINGSNTDILSTQFQSGTYKSNGIQLYKL